MSERERGYACGQPRGGACPRTTTTPATATTPTRLALSLAGRWLTFTAAFALSVLQCCWLSMMFVLCCVCVLILHPLRCCGVCRHASLVWTDAIGPRCGLHPWCDLISSGAVGCTPISKLLLCLLSVRNSVYYRYAYGGRVTV